LRYVSQRSDPQATQALQKDDVVKIQLGAHIDGFASIHAETIVVGADAANPVTGRRADVIKAAYTAAEAAMRTVKIGNKNWSVTDIVAKSASLWDCKPVEGTFQSLRKRPLEADSWFVRHALLPADPERHRWQEESDSQP
jgi:methionine aminopeptidase